MDDTVRIRKASISPSERLTVIFTTSLTPTAPSTELLSNVIQSFHRHCSDLIQCRVIVVIDGFDQIASKAQLKKGRVTAQQASSLEVYKTNVKKLIIDEFHSGGEPARFGHDTGEAEYGAPFLKTSGVAFTVTRTENAKITFIEPSGRLGFALAVRTALRVTDTEFVWIQQHDWALESGIPIRALLDVMRANESDESSPVKYICLPALRMLEYATSGDVVEFPALKRLTAQLKRDFVPPSQPTVKIPLTPLFFWHDKPHIASTRHYLDRVFPSRLAVLRGDFIEDKIGQRARAQMKEGIWSKWACWLYYPEDGKRLCLRHLNGRTWRGAETEARLISFYQERNRQEAQDRKDIESLA